ncbi:hypothetical protein AB0H76_17650 [Nocardia sp. NPDC050712]|uniref:hypothetical protein n=1 Tax=Nocardia sp. NPDC050712 TaxID=3155518 RepID=UPI0033E5506C
MTRLKASEKYAEAEQSSVDAVDVDTEMLAFSTLADIGHSDAHLLRTDRSADHSAEQWARAILEDVPAEVRVTLERAWKVIALSLAPVGAAHTIAGWSIAHTGPDYVLLQAESTFDFEGQLLFRRSEKGVLLATFVQFHDPAARAVWDRSLPSHLRFVRSLLEARVGPGPR